MISVVMPVRNEERLVARAIRSMLDQTFPDFELIVVDNASTDRTREIVAEFVRSDARVRSLIEPHPGGTFARNRGIDEARYPWIAAQDADDVSHPRRLEHLAAHVTRHPDVVLVGSWALCYSEITGLREPFHHAIGDHGLRRQLRTGPTPFVHSSVMFRRDAWARVGGYPEGYEPAEDYALWCLLKDSGHLANLPEHLVTYRHQDREPDSPYRIKERAAAERVKRMCSQLPTSWDERWLRVTLPWRRRRALARMTLDWPRELLARYGLAEVCRVASFRRA